jgi:hypothetical protein
MCWRSDGKGVNLEYMSRSGLLTDVERHVAPSSPESHSAIAARNKGNYSAKSDTSRGIETIPRLKECRMTAFG